MSDAVLPQYQFLPWFRQGLATRIAESSSQTVQRAGVTVNLEILQKLSEPIQKQVEFYGPGDVTGFSAKIVVRTDPKPNIGDFEPNYFPLIEFSEPDFPWRYTPLPPTEDNTKLRTWICLIALRAEANGNGGAVEFEIKPRTEEQPVSVIQVKRKSLPDLTQSWAWAHVQVTKGTDETIDLPETIRGHPERVLSRLLCPRKLEPGVLYRAFVVPAFEKGRLAGIGQDPAPASLNAHAWDVSTGNPDDPIDIPYYFDWQFRTGLRGDFEYMVRLLDPVELDKKSGVGQRDMNCANPGYNLPGVVRADKPVGDPKRTVMGLEGALTTVDAEQDPQEDVSLGDFPNLLTNLLNLPAEQLEKKQDQYPVVPPIYGHWHAARKKLPAANRRWLNELNLDPRNRAVAGFGTLVIQDQQENLMEESWRQIGAVNEANELIRQAQMGKAASERIHGRHLIKLTDAGLIRLTESVHARTLIKLPMPGGGDESVTIKRHLTGNGSRIPSVVLDPAFRRIARKRGPLRRRQQEDTKLNRDDILDRINRGEVVAAGPPPSTAPQRPPWAQGPLWKWLKVLHWILLLLIVILYLVLALLPRFGIPVSPTNPIVLVIGALLALISYIIRRWITPGLVAEAVQAEEITSDFVSSASGRPDFKLEDMSGADFTPGTTGDRDSAAARDFRQFAMAIQGFINPANVATPEPKEIELNKVKDALLQALDPKKTIKDRTKKRLQIRGVLQRKANDELDTIMAAPEFNQPMYEPLRDRSQELLLPGVGNIRQNTVSLLRTNPRFIKDYMVGLNHEMGRELLWREYPTDQRGSYFRQFWDVSRFIPPDSMLNHLEEKLNDSRNELSPEKKAAAKDSGLRESLKDIKPIHEWGDTSLSQSDVREPELQEQLVLLIRGDLLKKYPATIIYAAKARWDASKRTRWPILDEDEANRRDPVMGGTLPPDITFLGFALKKTEVDGNPKPGADVDNGWFFIIEEPVSETRFGLDAPPVADGQHSFATWDDLSWEYVKNHLQPSDYIDCKTAPLPENPGSYTWNSDAATLARITVQRPFRVAIHADDLLPDQ